MPKPWIDIAAVYDDYLVALYDRSAFAHELATFLQEHEVATILDCAAGTGFPALDLKAHHGLNVHCTDGESTMVERLQKNADYLGIPLVELRPPHEKPPQTDPMLVAWDDLDLLADQYDFVMCRGNSLVYHGTWNGRRTVVRSAGLRRTLATMARRVKPGGYLYLDGPVVLDIVEHEVRSFSEMHGYEILVKEQVEAGDRHRRWIVALDYPSDPTDRSGTFEATLYSAHLTIDRIMALLDPAWFEYVKPHTFSHERAAFGGAIAKRLPEPLTT